MSANCQLRMEWHFTQARRVDRRKCSLTFQIWAPFLSLEFLEIGERLPAVSRWHFVFLSSQKAYGSTTVNSELYQRVSSGTIFLGLGTGSQIRIQEKPRADSLKLVHCNSDHVTGKRVTAEGFAYQWKATNQIDSLIITINLCGAGIDCLQSFWLNNPLTVSPDERRARKFGNRKMAHFLFLSGIWELLQKNQPSPTSVLYPCYLP